MSTISARGSSVQRSWTVAGLYHRFRPILFSRIRHDPPPGSGIVDDVVRLNDHEDRLYELVDGILVQKTVGVLESWIAMRIGRLVGNFNDPQNLGFVTGEGGTIQLDLGLVQIPDVSFFSLERIPGGEIPEEPIPLLVPDLAVEVISRSNTSKEMTEKLHEYFAKGVSLVWYVRPKTRVVDVYTATDSFTGLTASMRLDGGDVLLGFSIQVAELFERPTGHGKQKEQKKNGPQSGKKNGPRRGR
jgi:Uma2 family endonuclease